MQQTKLRITKVCELKKRKITPKKNKINVKCDCYSWQTSTFHIFYQCYDIYKAWTLV